MKDIAAQLGQSFGSLTGVQKAGLAVIGAVTVGAVAWLGLGDPAGRYKAIAHDLADPSAAQSLARRLEAAGITARVAAGGRAVEVPDSQLASAARVVSERNAMPKRHQAMVAEIVKKNSMLLSTEERRMLIQRALESRLEDDIETYDVIEKASVNLSLPNEHAFAAERGVPKAAIILTLKQGAKPARELLRTIRASVSHAIHGLTPENITLSDSHGTDLGRPAEDAGSEDEPDGLFAYQSLYEQGLAAKACCILKPLFGEENYSVTVTAQVRPAGALSRPRPQAPRAQSQAQLASLGRLSEPAAAPSPVATQDTGGFGRISVSVLINSSCFAKGVLPEALRLQAERLVMAAVGFNPARCDVVSVVGAPFRQAAPAPAAIASVAAIPGIDALAPYATWIWGGGTGILVLILLGVLRTFHSTVDDEFLDAAVPRTFPTKGTLLDLSEREIQVLMAGDGKRDLAVVLASAPQPLRNFVLDRIAQEDRETFSAQIVVLGQTSIVDVQQARQRIFRRLHRDDDGSRPEDRRMN